MKNFLVPCDFALPAVNAFRFSLSMAIQSKANVHLLHAIQLPVLSNPLSSLVIGLENQYILELKANFQRQFKSLQEKYKSEGKGVHITFKLEFGSPSKTILDYASSQSIDLIIMGSHGSSGLRKIFIGSNAETIVRRSPVPVMVIKNHFTGEVKSIVFPNALEMAHQEALLVKIKSLQNFFHAKLHLVFINTRRSFLSDEEIHSKLDVFAKRFMLVNFTTTIYDDTDEEHGIIQFSKKIKADLIAMGTHGRRGITQLFNGSLAEDVTNDTETLIWTYSLKNQQIEA